jgi:arsenate reductase
MAEGLLRHLAGDSFHVESAGFEPRPLLPSAIRAMQLLGIDIAGAQSKTVFDLYRAGRTFDFVVTVCDESTAEQCPIFPGVCQRIHWSFPDPSAVLGSDEEKLQAAIEIRDQIRRRIEAWLEERR